MAESLSTERAGNSLTAAEFLAYFDRYQAIEDEIAETQETMRSIRRRRKDLRGTIKADGINLAAFDRARADENRSGEEREAEDRQYREYMAWLKKPVGFQADMFTPAEATEHELQRIARVGLEAGKRGDRADANPWTPGTEAFQQWHSSWIEGQKLKVEDEIRPIDLAERRGRGRPPGSKNRPKDDEPQPPEAA